MERVVPYWENCILASLDRYDQVLVAAHGNSLRAIVKILKGISDEDIVNLNLPTRDSLCIRFDDALRLRRGLFPRR